MSTCHNLSSIIIAKLSKYLSTTIIGKHGTHGLLYTIYLFIGGIFYMIHYLMLSLFYKPEYWLAFLCILSKEVLLS